MTKRTLSVIKAGMVSAVGLSAPATCAAIRCGMDNVRETPFTDSDGEWFMGSVVPPAEPWCERSKYLHMAASAIRECLAGLNARERKQLPLLLCVAEKNRPGRLDYLNEFFIKDIQNEVGSTFDANSAIFSNGCVGGAQALQQATALVYEKGFSYCLIAGVDTFLTTQTLAAYEEKGRLLTSVNSNGFIPGEGGAAVLIGAGKKRQNAALTINGIGFGTETGTIDSGEPLRADGSVQAFRRVFSATGLSMRDINYRITDYNGEQYKFKEGDLAVIRSLRDHKGEIDVWHPADCIGEVGAATVPFVIGVAEAAARKNYSVGETVLCHFSNDNGDRAAMILTVGEVGGN